MIEIEKSRIILPLFIEEELLMILITGSNGQLGTELCHLLDERNITYTATDAAEMDITHKAAVDEVFQRSEATADFPLRGICSSGQSRRWGKELDEKINVMGTKNIAEAAEAAGATLVYISTDYVFDGTNTGEYTTDAKTNPKNEYGRIVAGEQLVQSICSGYYIIRTSWVFGQIWPQLSIRCAVWQKHTNLLVMA